MSHHRREAVMRIAAFVVAILAAIILQFVIIVAIIWGIIDVAIELIADRDYLTADSSPARLISGFIMWPANLLRYSVTGAGEPMWTPEF